MNTEKLKDIVRPFIPDVIINMREEARNRKALQGMHEYKHLSSPCKGDKPFGVNFYGDTKAGTGLSRSAVILLQEIKDKGVPVHFHRVEEWSGEPKEEEGEGDYAINIFHLQPSVFLRFIGYAGQDLLEGHYNIGHWAWETPDVPSVWKDVGRYFDEMWCPSAFVADAIRKVTDNPVMDVHHGFFEFEDRDGAVIRKKYGIPADAFTVLILYDARSSAARKNPDAAVEAFVKAFPEMPEDVYLILKGKHFTAAQKKKLMNKLGNRKNVIQVDTMLPWDEAQELVAACDALISLHRAEGFGLPVAEMMSYGGVVIGTDYSATTEFMDADSGCPVAYKLIKTKVTHKPYPRGTVWADPDASDAAVKLKKVYEDPELRKRLGENAKKRVREILAAGNIGQKVYERLKQIYGE
ncbi:MAG: glycosyltransferase family 4 protein [Lachnospiraceae bacterium]|nr:glycosyltransferase family 4 protein [Lachnospiraceae bacterium]